MTETYTATKTRSARPGWSVTFRHPLRRDTRGKLGLKIRRGLGTTDDLEADKFVSQMNELLSDRRWWSADRRSEAEKVFSPQIVSAFFDGIEVGRVDTNALREALIPFPSRELGYPKIVLLGTTGAGKTTLLRHVIGSSHKIDRFPSTSTAKTTIADTEIITAGGSYEAAITFMSEFEVRAHIDECIEAACLAALDKQQDEKIASAFLVHKEERFRLSYILGEWSEIETSNAEKDEDSFDFEDIAPDEMMNEEGISDDEIETNRRCLNLYISRAKELTTNVATEIERDFGLLEDQTSPDDKAAWLELFSDALFDSEEFSRLALDVKDEIEKRFELIDGTLERSATGWPKVCSFQSDDRNAFLSKVRWFSGNHFQQFGRLLTPLVDGVRVRGPFKPLHQVLGGYDKLILIDGQGLGHTSESASTVSTRVTTRFADADLILLVDSSQQPLQAAPMALLRAIGSSGYTEKLAIAFTHFDLVKGDNLKTLAQKQNHVLAGIANAATTLRKALGAPVALALEKQLEKNVFFLGGLDREIEAIPSGVIGEMKKLLRLMQSSAQPATPVELAPIYVASGLETALRDAIEGFIFPWEARLGLSYRDGIRKENWTRIKALNRRIAGGWGNNEYYELMPVGDLISRLQEELSRWLNNPTDWTRTPKDEEEQAASISPVRRAVFTALHELANNRLVDAHRSDWMTAYLYGGQGSAHTRAVKIAQIYKEAAPSISSAMTKDGRDFVKNIVQIMQSSVENAGGQFNII